MIRLFSDARQINTDYSLLSKLNKELNKNEKNFYGMVFNKTDIKMLHAKVLVFDKPGGKSVVVVSSTNITESALCSNLELGIQLETQRSSDFYNDISRVIKALKECSHEPTEKEVRDYEENRPQIKRWWKESERKPTDKTGDEIRKIRKFRSEIKQNFDPRQLNIIQNHPKRESKSGENDAVNHFTELILQYRREFSQVDNFKLMLRIYANILNHGSKKPSLREQLTDLQQRIGIKNSTINQIYGDSVPGKYLALPRSVREPFRIRPVHVEATLDLIDRFYHGTDYEQLLYTFITFSSKTREMAPRGIGLVTGILASLQPTLFVVCNRRTRALWEEFEKPKYQRIINSSLFYKYPYFNEIFRYISEKTGRELRELDLNSGREF